MGMRWSVRGSSIVFKTILTGNSLIQIHVRMAKCIF